MENYEQLINNFEKSDNPIVKKMVNHSKEVVEWIKEVYTSSRMNEKEKIEYVLHNTILQIAYTHKDGEVSTYRCTSNPNFIALLSSNKFSEYLNISKDVKRVLHCRKTGNFMTWDLVRNRPIQLIIKKTKINLMNAIFQPLKLEIMDESKELIEATFKNLKRKISKKKDEKNEKSNDIKELFG